MLEKNLATRQAEKFVGENEPLRFTARNDFAFRLLFGSEENKEITMEFLSLVTNIDRALLKDIQMESPLLKKDYAEKKNGILDIKLLLQNGEKINVEMQNYWSPYFPRRSLYYWAKLYVEDFTQGAKYQRLMPCIVINIVNDRFPLSDKCHSVYQIMETGEHHVLDDVFEMHFLDLSKAREESQLGALKNWLVFIQTEDRKEREEMAKGNETLEKANTSKKQ
ncbi:MAG: Rpn family recombination-promoting nuclease/putative transposase [Eubacteriales bacterium]|nr:Rpn family recombination-promoting nuclease/putative transposase [Eubacteriales bacterium]